MPRSGNCRRDDAAQDSLVRFLVGEDEGTPVRVERPGAALEVLDSHPRTRRSNVLLFAAVLMVAASILVAGRIYGRGNEAHRQARPIAEATRARLATPDLSLTPLRHYTVTRIAVLTDKQVLWVEYEPTPTINYEGGTVTLYAQRGFAARVFLRSAKRAVVDGHVAYFGQYQRQFAVAWPVDRGRWVCLTGFIGSGNGADPATSRAQELTVASGVSVQ